MSRCPICGAEVYHTVSREWDICINSSGHNGQAYFLKRKNFRPEFEIELDSSLQERISKSYPRGGNCE